MLTIDYRTGIGRSISVKRGEEKDLYSFLITISASFMNITVKLSLKEAERFFTKGYNLVRGRLGALYGLFCIILVPLSTCQVDF